MTAAIYPLVGGHVSQDGGMTVVFAADVYSLDAIKRAAYVLMARATISIEPGEAELRCTIEPTPGEDLARLVRDFQREVLDQDLRLEVEAKTEPLRNMILGLAFSHLSQNG